MSPESTTFRPTPPSAHAIHGRQTREHLSLPPLLPSIRQRCPVWSARSPFPHPRPLRLGVASHHELNPLITQLSESGSVETGPGSPRRAHNACRQSAICPCPRAVAANDKGVISRSLTEGALGHVPRQKKGGSPRVCNARPVTRARPSPSGQFLDHGICWAALSPNITVAGISAQPPIRHMCADGMCIRGAPWLCKPIAYSSPHQSKQFKQVAMITCCFARGVAPNYPHTARLTHPQLHLNPNGRCLLVRCVHSTSPAELQMRCDVGFVALAWLVHRPTIPTR